MSLSIRFPHAIAFVAVAALAVSVSACDKKGDGAAPTGSTSTTTGAGSKPKSTLKEADVKAAYAAELEDMKKMNDPMDKKIAAFEAKVGKPTEVAGNKHVWYAVDGDKCHKIELDQKSGAMGDEEVKKDQCGM